MNHEQNSSLRQRLKVLLILTLISSCVFTLTVGTHTTRATRASESELIARARAAINGAENAGIIAQQKKLEADRRLEELKKFNLVKEPNRDSLIALGQVTTTVNAMSDRTTGKTLQQQLLDAQKSYVDALKELNDSLKALQSATPASQNIETAKTAVNNKIASIKPKFTPTGDGVPELSDTVKILDAALFAVYTTVGNLAAKAEVELDTFTKTSDKEKERQITRQQQELIYAIRNPLLKHLVGRIARLQDRVKEFKKLHNIQNRTNGLATNGSGTNGSASAPDPAAETALYQCLQKKLPKIFDTIHDEFLISPFDILNEKVELVDLGEGTVGLKTHAGLVSYNLRPSPARVAAADGMLDVYTKAFEDDIDRVFVRPMLERLREKLRKTGIGFGVIQRTSVLATNRMVARVDPRATAELSVGQETNLIQGLQSIAQIALASQSAGVLGGLSQLKVSGSREAPPEIYGITSGSAFQVTPIFDPTGQALRFKFDFVDATLVREPRGTVNPAIPRVQRHTVNTEVQLSNLELREVSRFESDAKIGIPTTYWGGLPLLKDLPGVRPIPLIGWFVRRKGSNAIAQRSLIFGQTTMSPTIEDILDLFDSSLQRR